MSIKEVSQDTNISAIYVEALEKENFEIFPGETYLIGFLRSYSDYLKLDPETILTTYKGYKIGESATPLEELTKPARQDLGASLVQFLTKYKSIAIVIILVVVVFALFKGISLFSKLYVPTDGTVVSENPPAEKKRDNITNIQLQNDRATALVYVNETVQFLVDNKEVVFRIKEIKDNSVVVEILPGNKSEVMAMEQTVVFNLPPAPREVKMTLKGLTPERAKIFIELGDKLIADTNPVEPNQDTSGSDVANTSVNALNPKNLKIVFEATFSERSFLEVYIDGVQKFRKFVNPDTHQRWEGVEFIQIKVGNAGGMKAKINGRDYSFGKSGQVVNKMVTWKKDAFNPNLYHIVVKDQ
ncbi:MAG: helix-turn-helix domain-containing protein [Leptospirales bacterium]|nr:helix-turn-helix domain-containing protein [Leptospirales bacterium]